MRRVNYCNFCERCGNFPSCALRPKHRRDENPQLGIYPLVYYFWDTPSTDPNTWTMYCEVKCGDFKYDETQFYPALLIGWIDIT